MSQISIYADGGSRGNPGKAAAAFVVIENQRVTVKKGFYLGNGTNNEAEYFSVIHVLQWLVGKKKAYKRVDVFLDSELVTKQLNGLYKVKSKNLISLMRKVRLLEDDVSSVICYRYVPRGKNRLADHIVNKVLDRVK